MWERTPVVGLFETHVTVRDLRRAMAFYRDVVGLPLALEGPDRSVAFFWIGAPGQAMLGLWDIGTGPLNIELHLAFAVRLEDLLEAPRRLRAHGVMPLAFSGKETSEPSVLGWMPAAAVYFRDPDGHLLEYLAMLDEEPRASVGVVAYSEWIANRST